jgi:hypothetical protein
MRAWIAIAVGVWLACVLLCWRIGQETGRRHGVLIGTMLGPLGVLGLALLPYRAAPGSGAAKLQHVGLIRLAARRRAYSSVIGSGTGGTIPGEEAPSDDRD